MTSGSSKDRGARDEASLDEKQKGRPLSRGLVKTAGLSILPWTVGSLLSPLGEPHPALLALPLLALAVLILAVRAKASTTRPWIPWTFVVLLLVAAITRFLALPLYSELTTGTADAETVGASLTRVFLLMTGLKVFFYLVSGGLLAYGLLRVVKK